MVIIDKFNKGGDLKSNFERINDLEKLKIFFDICNGMIYLHERNILHLDLKAQNIVYDNSNFQSKILDFGTSTYKCNEMKKMNSLSSLKTRNSPFKKLSENSFIKNDDKSIKSLKFEEDVNIEKTSILLNESLSMNSTSYDTISSMNETKSKLQGTLSHLSPESFKQIYTKKNDIYSFGCVIYELITETYPWRFDNWDTNEEIQKLIIEESPFLPEDEIKIKDKNIYNFLSKMMKICMMKEYKKRPNFLKIKMNLVYFLNGFVIINKKRSKIKWGMD
jgi:serine/threonine protein kinase